MGSSKIEWTDAVWNCVTGCSPVSSGCDHCYARKMATRLAGRCGYPKDEPFKVMLHPERLSIPRHWRKPRRVFVDSMADLFHPEVPSEFLDRVFAVMSLCKQHTFQILTKRPQAMAAYLGRIDAASGINRRDYIEAAVLKRTQFGESPSWPLPNVWLGVSAENQAVADERIPLLLQCPAARRFVSCEPLLGLVDLRNVAVPAESDRLNNAAGLHPSKFSALTTEYDDVHYHQPPAALDWVIAGGENGPGARPCHPAWVWSIRDQCQAAGVPFFWKGRGEYRLRRKFETFEQWVSKASSWLACYRSPVCMDHNGLICLHGADFDKAAYPVGIFERADKKVSGRLLEGREWNESPTSV